MMSKSLVCGLCIVAALVAQGAEPQAACPIVPTPKVYKASGRTAELLSPGAAAIVVGAKACEPERYAAERLQGLIERRFKRRLPIVAEGQVGDAVKQVILLGQRATNAWLDRLCRAKQIDLSPTSPGHDGFVVEVVEEGGRQAVVVGGSNPRGVVYGQDAFFDLLQRHGGKVTFPVVSVRDWPSIAWRGRPLSWPERQLVPGVFDAYVRARMNWVDLRDGPTRRRGQFGIPPGFDFDKAKAKAILREAHRRGFFVYGTVFCGVKPDKFDAVIAKFQEVVDLGVDGLWLSFDDPGPGKDAPKLIARVLAFGRKHGMTGRKIMVVPPTGSYQKIRTDFNLKAAAVPGFEAATWMFTRVPCGRDAARAKALGLKRPPGWWHNWPRATGGFLHDSYGGTSLRVGGKPAYLDCPPLNVGWHRPRYERLRDAAETTDTVMLWGGWPEEYVCSVLSLWAWDPARHDWATTRRAIHAHVFGAAQAEAAAGFDDDLALLKKLFVLPVYRTKPKRGWPPRLKRIDQRPAALEHIDRMDAALRKLEAAAPADTMLDVARLRERFLEPMRATTAFARAMATLDYPEYALAGLDDKMIALLRAGQGAEAERTLAEARGKVTSQLAAVTRALQGLEGIEEYAAPWRDKVAGLDHWRKLVQKMEDDMRSRLRQVVSGSYDKLLARIGQPPPGRVVAELSAADWTKQPPSWRGPWAIGTIESKGRHVVVIGFPGKTRSHRRDYAELCAELPAPQAHGRVGLQAFINDTKVEKRWKNYRFLQLWLNDKMIWHEDIAKSREGNEWVTIDITAAARGDQPLRLKFRVWERQRVFNYESVAVLGPVRLVVSQAKEDKP